MAGTGAALGDGAGGFKGRDGLKGSVDCGAGFNALALSPSICLSLASIIAIFCDVPLARNCQYEPKGSMLLITHGSCLGRAPDFRRLIAVGRLASNVPLLCPDGPAWLPYWSKGACCAWVTVIFLPRRSLSFAMPKALCASYNQWIVSQLERMCFRRVLPRREVPCTRLHHHVGGCSGG